jgi:hypothetical protein
MRSAQKGSALDRWTGYRGCGTPRRRAPWHKPGRLSDPGQYGQRPLRQSAKRASLCDGLLQRDPDSEEVEAPLVELRIPEGVFLVAPVVDGAIPPLSAGRWEGSVPVRPRWCTRSPGCGSVTPRGAVEVAALAVAMPRAGTARSAGTTRSVRSGPAGTARSARSAGSVGSGAARAAWTARSAGSVGSGAARSTWTARSAGTGSRPTGSAGTVRIARCRPALAMEVSECLRAVVAARSTSGRRPMVAAGWWRSGSGAGRAGTHTHRRCSKSAGDGDSRHQLLQFHGPSPVYLRIQWTSAPRQPER